MGIIKALGQGINQIGTIRDLKKAETNLENIQKQGVTSTLTPELQESMRLAMKEYEAAQERAKFGFTSAEKDAYGNAINRAQISQIAAASEAGGGQAARYMAAVGSSNKTDNLLDMMSKDATLRLQKQQQAQASLSPVISTSATIQDVKTNDLNRYNNLLMQAGQAISDLRMQKRANTESIFDNIEGGAQNATIGAMAMKNKIDNVRGGASDVAAGVKSGQVNNITDAVETINEG